MGAVTSLMYGAEDPSIAGMVLDSSFSDLVDLMMELVDTYKFRLPKFTVKFAIQIMRKAILKKAKFDITELNTIKVAQSSFVPVLIGHAIDDDFIRPHHSDRIYDAYVGDKNIIKFEGDHNSPRPQFYFDSINIFFHNVLQPPEDEVGGTFFDSVPDYFGKGSWTRVNEVGYSDHESINPSRASSSTEDAIKQVRSKRPMSRTEVPSDIPSRDEQYEAEDERSMNDPLSSSSSSKMISFELSNGHPYGPNVPASIDDDQYVEYPLDNLADFPSNVEEEERMFMEAVIESLRDLEARHPNDVEEQPSGVDVKSSSQQDDVAHCKTELTPVCNGYDPVSPDMSVSSMGTAFDTPASVILSGSTGTSTRSDVSVCAQSSSDADMVNGTKATLTVVKSPSGHIMDGLMRRWDLNFFRSR